jgi:thiol-disulfide isomerase/thioredoxin
MSKMIQYPKSIILFISAVLFTFYLILIPESSGMGMSSDDSHSVQSLAQLATETPTPSESCLSCEVFDMEKLSATTTAIAQNLTATASSPTPQLISERVPIYFFWGDGCPHCAAAKPFLQSLEDRYPQVELLSYEVYYVAENIILFDAMANAYGFEPRAVPTIFIGEKYWEGYVDTLDREIESAVQDCISYGCVDKGKAVIENMNPKTTHTPVPAVTASHTPPSTITVTVNATEMYAPVFPKEPEEKAAATVQLPIFGPVDFSHQSIVLSTVLISIVDGFNPCSIWVLTMLLALTLHTGSRKKVLLIGIIFLTTTAAIYGLFIAGMFTMLKVISFVGWIQAVVALIALFFALVNIKDYFWYKEGISFTIADDKKPGIYQRMRKIMDAGQSFWGLVGGTIILAAGVSLVEFSCTSGFPVLWSNLLVSQNVSVLTFALLLLLYLIIYQLDELGIFMAAVFSMRASRLEEKHGRILKLVGGVLMLTLAMVMLIKPSLMNDITSSLIVFAVAFVIILLILVVHRLILPRF